MADITKCVSEKCPIADQCYRVTSKHNPYYQSYANFENECNKQTKFCMFINAPVEEMNNLLHIQTN